MQFQEKVSSLSMFRNVLTLQTAQGNFLMLCQMILLPNINFLISKQKTPKLMQKWWSSRLVLQILDIPCLIHKQTALELNINTVNRYINISTSVNSIYSLACFCFDTNVLNKFSCLVCTWFHYLLYKFKRHSKLHLNSHPIKNLLIFASVYLVKLYNFYADLSLETEFPALKLTQICCINMKISFLENWQSLNLKLAPPLLLTYQAWKSNLTIWQNMKVSGIQKFQFSSSTVSWQKFQSTA